MNARLGTTVLLAAAFLGCNQPVATGPVDMQTTPTPSVSTEGLTLVTLKLPNMT